MAISNKQFDAAMERQAKREMKEGKIKPSTQRWINNHLNGKTDATGDRAKWADHDRAANKEQLRLALGLSKSMLYKYLEMHGAPTMENGRWNVDKVREFMSANGYQKQNGSPGQKAAAIEAQAELPADHPQRLRAEAARMKIAREKREMDMLDREFIARSEANEWIAKCNAVVKRDLEKALGHELPPLLEGCTAAEMSEMIMRKLADVLAHLPESLRDEK